MTLVAAAVCPHPPLLVPEIAAGAAMELDELREAVDSAVRRLLKVGADRLVTVGGGACTFTADKLESGYWADYGMPDRGVPEVWPGQHQPLSLRVAAWLLDRVDDAHAPSNLMSVLSVAEQAPAVACARLGAELAGTAERVAMLVMGDGSAGRSTQATGHVDPRAEPYDKRVAAALRTADAPALLSLDEELSRELQVAGRAPWQVLAGAVLAGDRRPWRAELHYDQAPYGVAYFVAYWELVAGAGAA